MEYRRHTLNSYDEENPYDETIESWPHPEQLTTWKILYYEFKNLMQRCMSNKRRNE